MNYDNDNKKSVISFSNLTKTFLSSKNKKPKGKYSSIYRIQQELKNSSKNKNLKTNIHTVNTIFNKNYGKFRCIDCEFECICFVSSKVKFHEDVHVFNGKNIMIKKLSDNRNNKNNNKHDKLIVNLEENVDIDMNMNMDMIIDMKAELDDDKEGIDLYDENLVSKFLHNYSTPRAFFN